MIKKHLGVVVDWFGPYDVGEKLPREDWERPGLYLGIGERKRTGTREIEYIGKSGNLRSRVRNKHHRLPDVIHCKLWLGEIVNRGNQKTYLHYAEWCLVFGLDAGKNIKLKTPPIKAVTVLNRWWKDETNRCKRPHPKWPDVVDFLFLDQGQAEATLQWIDKSRRVERKFSNRHWISVP